jgi:hypothetical protein
VLSSTQSAEFKASFVNLMLLDIKAQLAQLAQIFQTLGKICRPLFIRLAGFYFVLFLYKYIYEKVIDSRPYYFV